MCLSLLSLLPIHFVPDIQANREECKKNKKSVRIAKEKKNVLLFAGDTVVFKTTLKKSVEDCRC